MVHSPTVYHPGVNHAHTPSGGWATVQAAPASDWDINLLAARLSPRQVVDAAIFAKFRDKPIALLHLNYYLAGTGVDYVENANISLMLRTDTGVQALLRGLIPAAGVGLYANFVKVEQVDYANQDLRFAFGAIDRLDFEVDYAGGTIKAWFQDRYEWHPYYPALYTVLAGDAPARPTNAVHAALVELKSSGAADFWMKGEATEPLSFILPAAAAATSRTRNL